MSMIRDGDWMLLDYDPATQKSTWAMFNPDGSTTVRTDMPVDAVIDENKAALAATEGQRFGEWNRAASIPLPLYHSSGMAEAVKQDDQRFISKFLNDTDNRAWRTSRGNV